MNFSNGNTVDIVTASLVAMTALVIGAIPAWSGDVAITPSMIDLEVEPGHDHTMVLQIMHTRSGPDDDTPLRLVLTAESWEMNVEGELSFIETDAGPGTAIPFVRFSPGEIELAPGQTAPVRISAIVPEGASPGEYRAALVVQPRMPYHAPTGGERRMAVRFRLACIVYVEVPPVTPAIELVDLAVVQRDGIWEVVPTIANSGDVHLRVFDTVDVFTLDGGRDASVAPSLATGEIAHQLGQREAGVVLPRQIRKIPRPLPPEFEEGRRYRVVYQADAGRGLPIVVGETTFVVPRAVEVPVTVAERE